MGVLGESTLNLLTVEAREEASKQKAREAALQPLTKAGLLKFTMVTLKAVLEHRGQESIGNKVELVDRLLGTLQP